MLSMSLVVLALEEQQLELLHAVLASSIGRASALPDVVADVTVRGWRKGGDGSLLPTARRSASAFAWNDQFTLTPQPALFMMPRAKKPPIAA